MINNNTLQLESETTTGLYDKVITRTYEAGEQRTYFLYSDEGLVGEYDATGAEIKTYGYKPNSTWTTDPLFMKQGADYYFYQNDQLGTPMIMTDINGNIVWSAVYDSFGKAQIQITAIENNLRFSGQYYDAETGLHYNWHRYYDPALGRYLTTDPIGFLGGDVNLYAYVGNNPVNLVDPTGLASIGGGAGGFFTIVGGFFNISYVSCCENGVKHHYTVLQYAFGLGLGLQAGARISPSGIIGPSNCPVKEGTVKYVCAAGAYGVGLSGCVPAENLVFDFTGGSWGIVGGMGGYVGAFAVTTKILQDVPSGSCCEKGK